MRLDITAEDLALIEFKIRPGCSVRVCIGIDGVRFTADLEVGAAPTRHVSWFIKYHNLTSLPQDTQLLTMVASILKGRLRNLEEETV